MTTFNRIRYCYYDSKISQTFLLTENTKKMYDRWKDLCDSNATRYALGAYLENANDLESFKRQVPFYSTQLEKLAGMGVPPIDCLEEL